jgi:signal transduction histidine kinase
VGGDAKRRVVSAAFARPDAPAIADGLEGFAAYAAHELRGPIAFQRALVEVTLADPRADAAVLREMGERVVESCTRQQRLIDALLDLARGGRPLTRREPVDLAAIAADALRAHAHDLDGLSSVVELEPARTTGDPDLVGRLVVNLVSNAIRHNLAGGRVEVATRTESGRALFAVANTGPSVPAGELRRLFQPFQRLVAQPTEGVGLGLAIVQAIADAHRAAVTARARAGGGLEVGVSFPAARAPLREARAASAGFRIGGTDTR